MSKVTRFPGGNERRLDLPAGFPPAEAAIWRALVNSRPADYFDAASGPLLEAYCRHIVTASRLDHLLNGFELKADMPREEFAKYERLSRMRDNATKSMLNLARTMRLTQQSRYTPHAKGARPTAGSRPWDSPK